MIPTQVLVPGILIASGALLFMRLGHNGGNQAMALAAYNAGTGGVENAVRACGTNWQACLPQETQAYIRVILA